MYHGTTLAPALSNVFESLPLCIYKDFLVNNQLQFGFKKKTSCMHALFILNNSVKYFTKRESKVYCGLLDGSKAFDKVLHINYYYY